MKTIITITGIRPDFIRMSEIFKKLDKNFNHILIHTGQHFDTNLSDIFFKDLNIRKPDYNWGVGKESGDHFEQLANLALKIKEFEPIIKTADLVIFLGDSNSVLASILIKKLGVKVAHIEAGMRSGDKTMFEETNRTICDHCSDLRFCYHQNYYNNLCNENLGQNSYVVGNTITEVIKQFIPKEKKLNKHILVDIHRPENFLFENRLKNILIFANNVGKYYGLPIYLLNFNRMINKIKEFNLNIHNIKIIDQMGFLEYINSAYHSQIIISDSGTAQEELVFLKTPVIVPRDYTERWESIENNCSLMLNVNQVEINHFAKIVHNSENLSYNTDWLGNGKTSTMIINHIKKFLNHQEE